MRGPDSPAVQSFTLLRYYSKYRKLFLGAAQSSNVPEVLAVIYLALSLFASFANAHVLLMQLSNKNDDQKEKAVANGQNASLRKRRRRR